MAQTSYAQSHVGTVRTVNEDAYLELSQHGIWVVADGMGGHEAGDVASQLIIDTIGRSVNDKNSDDLTCDLLRDALHRSNHKLQQMMASNFDGKVIGSTVVVLFIKDGSFHCLWAGDSRGYLLRNNKLTQITRDHSQVNDMVDEGIIEAHEAESHPLANVITRAVGVDSELDVDVVVDKLLPGDVFLLCSDGLNKEVSDIEIEETLLDGNIIDAGMALTHACLVRNARDNVTCIVIDNSHSSTMCDEVMEDKTIPLFIK